MSKRPKRTPVTADDAANPDIRYDVKVADAGNDGNSNDAVSGAGGDTGPITDPGAVAGSSEPIPDAPPRRGRGRPPGSGTGSKKQTGSLPLNVSGLEKLLVGIHGGVAILSGRSEWSLDTDSKIFDGKTEAEFLAASIKDVADHYGNGLLDKKTLDWCNLVQCLAIVYGGRVYAIRANPRIKAPRPAGPAASRTANPAPSMHVTAPPVNSFDPDADPMKNGVGEIPGLGAVEFPDGHPLKPKLN